MVFTVKKRFMKELKLKKLIKILDSLVNCRFSYAANQELVIYLSGQKTLAAYENIGRKNSKILTSQETDKSWTDRTEQYAKKIVY